MKTKSLTKVTLLSIFVMSVVTAVTLNSCQKEVLKPKAGTSKPTNTKAAFNPFINSNKLFDEVSGMMFSQTKNSKGLMPHLDGQDSSGCTIITIDTTKPYTKTFNYGSGCIGSDGKMRSGIVSISCDNQDLHVVNNVFTMTFQNYNFDGSNLNGQIAFSNTGYNTNGNIVLTYTGTWTEANGGQTDTFNVNYAYEWIAGYSNNPPSDIQLSITGGATGSSSTGQHASNTVTSALTKNCKTPGCNYIISGTTYTVLPDTTQNSSTNYAIPGGCSGQMSVTQSGVTSLQNQ